jgi:hypothetical protein
MPSVDAQERRHELVETWVNRYKKAYTQVHGEEAGKLLFWHYHENSEIITVERIPEGKDYWTGPDWYQDYRLPELIREVEKLRAQIPLGHLTTCDNCGYFTVTSSFVTHRIPGLVLVHQFCDICADTYLSQATSAPHTVADPRLYKSMGYIANLLLEAIKKGPLVEAEEE